MERKNLDEIAIYITILAIVTIFLVTITLFVRGQCTYGMVCLSCCLLNVFFLVKQIENYEDE